MAAVGDGFGPDTPRAGFDVHGLDQSDRVRLAELLDQYGVPHEYVGPELQVPASESELVEDLVALVDSPPASSTQQPSPWGRGGQAPLSAIEEALAPRWLRLIGWLAESAVISAIATSTWLIGRPEWSGIVTFVLGIVSGVVLVGLTARTAGMWLFGMEITETAGQQPPAWSTTVVRFVVASWPGLLGVALIPAGSGGVDGVLGTVGLVWFFLCYGALLFDPMRRGLHDRAARTLVVRR